jgi:hypothetical protein
VLLLAPLLRLQIDKFGDLLPQCAVLHHRL